MPNGFKPVSVREEVYVEVKKIAADEDKSVADVISEAILNYRDYRKQLLKDFERIKRLLEANPTVAP